MCVTTGPAQLSKTILYAGEAQRDGKTVHVLGYQNRAETRAGPNAMVLPFPSLAAMGPNNVIDTTDCKRLLKDLSELGRPKMLGTKGGGSVAVSRSAQVQVFHKGSYTVVMSRAAQMIPEALEQVPESRRPKVHPELFEAYRQWYPQWPIALCCWDGAVEAEPLLWWYEPKDPTKLFYPGLDSHTGGVPVLGQRVKADHTLIFQSAHGPSTKRIEMTDDVRPYIAPAVESWPSDHRLLNGDWWLPLNSTPRNFVEALRARQSPPGAV